MQVGNFRQSLSWTSAVIYYLSSVGDLVHPFSGLNVHWTQDAQLAPDYPSSIVSYELDNVY
jgi:hypothetical protein